MSLTELNRSVYRTGWYTVENLAEDADDDFFQSCPTISYLRLR